MTRCALCDRELLAGAGQRVHGQLHLCPGCYDRPARIRTAASERFAGVRTFYVASFTTSTDEYVVKRTPGRMACTCPNYVHVGQVLGVPCKHVRLVKLFIRACGGINKVPHGVEVAFRLANPAEVKRRRRREVHA